MCREHGDGVIPVRLSESERTPTDFSTNCEPCGRAARRARASHQGAPDGASRSRASWTPRLPGLSRVTHRAEGHDHGPAHGPRSRPGTARCSASVRDDLATPGPVRAGPRGPRLTCDLSTGRPAPRATRGRLRRRATPLPLSLALFVSRTSFAAYCGSPGASSLLGHSGEPSRSSRKIDLRKQTVTESAPASLRGDGLLGTGDCRATPKLRPHRENSLVDVVSAREDDS